ncbi:acetamidase [Granulicella sp. WH15]|uniref:acetamidase/formamidase family protein n=1 Tax=Granulicella sp. WH15 TaxID=2602070 RepID=UPI001367198D|nr:acetamidase/formamidase family protein [Granulicella sp. WH15]QHN02982.1 acetamidase [Granulicella sp. WH15]
MREHILSAEPTHSVWNRDLEPRLVVSSGDVVHMACTDATGGQLTLHSTATEFMAIDRTRIHALTGPIAVAGAEPGDVLQVDVLEVAHKGWAWTSVTPAMGYLSERFTEPYLFHWQLEPDVTRSLAPAIVPLRPFCGVMGVAQAETGAFRTRPPGPFGGNLDVRELSAGATLYLPVFVPGALFSAGDAHAAQGDGEICINGMECPSDVTVRLTLHKHQPLSGPLLESAPRTNEHGPAWITIESGPDAFKAGQAATSRMVDLLAARWGLSEVHAYLLCSVAMNLRLSQVVNTPMVTVSAAIQKSILPERKLF